MIDWAAVGRALMMAAGGLAAGAVVGVTAWGQGRVPVLAVGLPLLVVFSLSRIQAFCVALGYALGLMRFSAAFVARWFDDNVALGAAVVIVFALVTATVWCLGWSRSPRMGMRVLAITGAWLLALAANIGIPGHPLVAMGYVLPGLGWMGVAVSLAIPAVALAAARLIRAPQARTGLAGAALASLTAAGFLLCEPPPGGPVHGIEAQATRWGALKGEEDALSRMQRMGAAKPDHHASVMVWPESIIGRYDPSMYQALDVEVLQGSRRAGRTQIIGMDIPLPDNQLLNSAVAFYPDGRTATAVARQPAPLSLWRPWRQTDTFFANWTAHNILNVGQGERAAVIFCYEEYMPVLYLLNEARDSPTIYLALTNTWAAKGPEAAAIQTWHSLGMARLFGRPYIKAENRPAA